MCYGTVRNIRYTAWSAIIGCQVGSMDECNVGILSEPIRGSPPSHSMCTVYLAEYMVMMPAKVPYKYCLRECVRDARAAERGLMRCFGKDG